MTKNIIIKLFISIVTITLLSPKLNASPNKDYWFGFGVGAGKTICSFYHGGFIDESFMKDYVMLIKTALLTKQKLEYEEMEMFDMGLDYVDRSDSSCNIKK